MNFSGYDDRHLRKEPPRLSKGILLFGIVIGVILVPVFLKGYLVCFVDWGQDFQEETEAEVRERVMHHPFWRVELTAEAVNEIADTIIRGDETSLVFVSEDGEVVIDADPAHIDQSSEC